MRIIPFEPSYRDDLIFMILTAKNALGCVPRLNEDLLDIPAHYAADGAFYLAIDETNRVIGSVGIQIRDHTARLHRLFILPSLKRRGIGSALLETAEAFARKKEAREVIVHLGDPQYYWESACFYPHHGYTEFAPTWMRKELK